MRQDLDKFKALHTEIVVIGPEDVDAFADYFTRHDLPFIGLSDPEHRVGDLYGQEVKLLKLGRMPAQVLVDKEGMIRHVHYGQSMADIPDNQEILAIIRELEAGNAAPD